MANSHGNFREQALRLININPNGPFSDFVPTLNSDPFKPAEKPKLSEQPKLSLQPKPSDQPKIHIHLRYGLDFPKNKGEFNNPNCKIYGEKFIQDCLDKISNEICKNNGNKPSIELNIGNDLGKTEKLEIKFPPGLSLRHLQILARSDAFNTSGNIHFANYEIDEKTNTSPLGFTKEIVLSLKDLVQQTVIVGPAEITGLGGFNNILKQNVYNPPHRFLMCSLSGIQFQDENNIGRLVLIPQNPADELKKGFLDNDIYRHIVGSNPLTREQIPEAQYTGRLVHATFKGKAVYFDRVAYQAFVANNFQLSALALNKAEEKSDLDFRFTRYGCGAFAQGLTLSDPTVLEASVVLGIYQGLINYFAQIPPDQRKIKHLTLPHFNHHTREAKMLMRYCKENGLTYSIEPSDVFAEPIKVKSPDGTVSTLKPATTDSSDPNTGYGNEVEKLGHHTSLESNMAFHTKSPEQLCTVLNKEMGEEHVKLTPFDQIKATELLNTALEFKTLYPPALIWLAKGNHDLNQVQEIAKDCMGNYRRQKLELSPAEKSTIPKSMDIPEVMKCADLPITDEIGMKHPLSIYRQTIEEDENEGAHISQMIGHNVSILYTASEYGAEQLKEMLKKSGVKEEIIHITTDQYLRNNNANYKNGVEISGPYRSVVEKLIQQHQQKTPANTKVTPVNTINTHSNAQQQQKIHDPRLPSQTRFFKKGDASANDQTLVKKAFPSFYKHIASVTVDRPGIHSKRQARDLLWIEYRNHQALASMIKDVKGVISSQHYTSRDHLDDSHAEKSYKVAFSRTVLGDIPNLHLDEDEFTVHYKDSPKASGVVARTQYRRT